MAATLLDRNVLLGELVVHHQWLTRAGLAEAYQSWQRDPSKSFAEHLLKEKRVLPSQLSALEGMSIREAYWQHAWKAAPLA